MDLIITPATIHTHRLLLRPYTVSLATAILNNQLEAIHALGLKPGEGWPDADTLDTVPRILKNLEKVDAPTGFESWMIIKKEDQAIIGDAGFKGVPNAAGQIDIGYGIIAAERKKGYALEAAKGLMQWAFTNDSVKEITARCLVGNTASVKVLEKMGFNETSRDKGMIHWSFKKKLL